jgi:hypothetical protein
MDVTMARPADGPVLGRGPVRHVDVDVDLVELRRLDPDLRADGPHVGRRRLDRLLHHVAELAGGLHPALAGQRSASMDRRSPPTEVQARPVTTPIWSSFSARP